MIEIALVYAHDDGGQKYAEFAVPSDTTIMQALELSGWLMQAELADFAAWCQQNLAQEPIHRAWFVGVYSEKKRLDYVLKDGDRIEIYRPLSADPMSRRKAKSTKKVKKLRS